MGEGTSEPSEILGMYYDLVMVAPVVVSKVHVYTYIN